MAIKVFILVLAALVIAEAAVAPTQFQSLVNKEYGAKAQNCQCMPGRLCDGEINSDVQCHPSYIMICCIRPTPEPIPEYVPEAIRV